MMQHHFHEAYQSYDEAVRLRPDRFSAWLGRGMASKALGDTENARADFEISYRLFPNRLAADELYDHVYRPKQKPTKDSAPAEKAPAEDTDDPDSPAFAARHPDELADEAAPILSVHPGSEDAAAAPLLSESAP